MTKLSDTQSILLATAASRDDGSIHPLPTNLTAPTAAVIKSLAALLKRGFVEQRDAASTGVGEGAGVDRLVGLFITAAGEAAVGVEDEPQAAREAPAPKAKSAAVLLLLQRDGGATLDELIAATGWLPHTTRAALTGLRKKGHAVERSKRGDATCYRIVAAA